MIPDRFLPALRIIHAALLESQVDWAVTGSMGMVLQGMDLPINDIDIQTDEDGTYEVERRLAQYVIVPVLYKASERIRSRLGKLNVEGIQVEIMGGIQKRSQEGEWEEPVQVARHRLWVDVEGLSLPVLSLEYEYQAYKIMGRDEKAARIRAFLDQAASG